MALGAVQSLSSLFREDMAHKGVISFLTVLLFHCLNPATAVTVSAAADAAANQDQFVFSGFTGANLTLDGTATITADGILELTNGTVQLKGHAFHPAPVRLRTPSSPGGGTVRSFSASFAFAIQTTYPGLSCHGIAFTVASGTDFSSALAAQYMGLANIDDNGNATNRFFAAEIDTMQNVEFQDVNNNHVGVDVNGLRSVEAHPAGYYDDANNGSFHGMDLIAGEVMQAWVEYDGEEARVDVTIAPVGVSKPVRPLVTTRYNLSDVLAEPSYVGFSSATGPINSRHYILGWSFAMDGPAPAIDVAKLPKLPRLGPKPRSKVLEILLPIATALFIVTLGTLVVMLVRRRMRYAELREDWEVDFGPHRFSYKDLFNGTDGFKDKHLLGQGGFGRVYRGVLPKSKLEVAVKRVSHESRQGMKEFVAEVVSIGRIRHRNLVQLLGYCRRKGELLLVYDYMSNGSLDKYLHYEEAKPVLDWAQRMHIIRGVASGLLYLHEKWEKVVIHRDVKASNVLLDKEMNGRLGDFGLARLYDHGTDPQTTHMVGTMGYLAPELVRTGKASPLTDVFAFGTFLLEVTCGQRPIKDDEQGDQLLLVDWVLDHWHNGTLLATVDTRLKGNYNAEEVYLVLKLGLLCSHPSGSARPSMQKVMDYLDGDSPVPELASTQLSFNMLAMLQNKGLDPYIVSCPPSSMMSFGAISDLSGGR
ncbi:L-type lectin-domain containing receptor kinase IV.1 [Sorghum bicolor]|nr:L-type lectin-domain containing receptor kinase IV.1 [Sorghum bicolor]|eukprot:XP_002461413.2 L-type lectin-domain containing receptor kinase IV.1 [Sorghum bicolor]